MSTSTTDQPFVDLYQFSYPEFGPTWVVQAKDSKQQLPHAHLKALIYNNMNGVEGQLLRGEILIALRLMNGQLKRARFIKHFAAPVRYYPYICLFMKYHILELTSKPIRFFFFPSWAHSTPELSKHFSQATNLFFDRQSYMISVRKTKLRSTFLHSGTLANPLVIRRSCQSLLIRYLGNCAGFYRNGVGWSIGKLDDGWRLGLFCLSCTDL